MYIYIYIYCMYIYVYTYNIVNIMYIYCMYIRVYIILLMLFIPYVYTCIHTIALFFLHEASFRYIG